MVPGDLRQFVNAWFSDVCNHPLAIFCSIKGKTILHLVAVKKSPHACGICKASPFDPGVKAVAKLVDKFC